MHWFDKLSEKASNVGAAIKETGAKVAMSVKATAQQVVVATQSAFDKAREATGNTYKLTKQSLVVSYDKAKAAGIAASHTVEQAASAAKVSFSRLPVSGPLAQCALQSSVPSIKEFGSIAKGMVSLAKISEDVLDYKYGHNFDKFGVRFGNAQKNVRIGARVLGKSTMNNITKYTGVAGALVNVAGIFWDATQFAVSNSKADFIETGNNVTKRVYLVGMGIANGTAAIAAGALIGAAVGTAVPVPIVGTAVGLVAGALIAVALMVGADVAYDKKIAPVTTAILGDWYEKIPALKW